MTELSKSKSNSRSLRPEFWVLLGIMTVAGLVLLLESKIPRTEILQDRAYVLDPEEGANLHLNLLKAGAINMICYAIHAFYLMTLKRTAGIDGAVAGVICPIVAMAVTGGILSGDANGIIMPGILLTITGFMVYRRFSVPSSLGGTFPLLLLYMIIAIEASTGSTQMLGGAAVGGAVLFIAGYWMPGYRRWVGYLRPEPLPKLAARKRGMTLIELLIVVAILSIISVAITNMSGAAFQTLERQRTRRDSLQLIQDQVALIRGSETALEVGTFDFSKSLQDDYSFEWTGSYEIEPGPSASVYEVRLNLTTRGQGFEQESEFATLVEGDMK